MEGEEKVEGMVEEEEMVEWGDGRGEEEEMVEGGDGGGGG